MLKMLKKSDPKPKAPASKEPSPKKPFYKRTWFIVIVALLVLGMVGSCGDESAQEESAQSGVGAGAESGVVSDAESSVVNEQTGVELVAVTEQLEYSGKEVDPLTLVEASVEGAEVSTGDSIDLKTVGVQAVTYEIVFEGQTTTQTIEFTVKDTKAPAIVLADENPSIDQGGTFDFSAAVSSVEDEVDGALAYDEREVPPREAFAGLEVVYDQGWYTFEGEVDSSTPGDYPIKVVATDRHGMTSTREFVVTVMKPATAANTPPAAVTHTYVLNTNSMKFHVAGCSSASQIKSSNRGEITATRDEVISMGYKPCGRCNP